jgi:cysteine-rich repeat protein
MKTYMGIRCVALFFSCSALLLGCRETETTLGREARMKCQPPGDYTPLPSRFEAEDTYSQATWPTHQLYESDSLASNARVHTLYFQGAGKHLDYYFLSNNQADAEVWIGLRKGSNQGSFEFWVDNSNADRIAVDGYNQSVVFDVVKIGSIGGTQSPHKVWHAIHMVVTGKNSASSSYGATIDFFDLRAVPVQCENQPDGTVCNDGNACTQTDQCQSGSCIGSNPVVCTALDACHAIGVCDQATGLCSNPNQPDNTACNDSNACTQTDQCQAGSCVGSNPVICTALNACHTVGVCDQATGLCSNPVQPEGTACNDNNLCTQQDICFSGTCVGRNPVTCPTMPNCQTQGVCAPDTGLCSEASQCSQCGNRQVEFGEECDDGNLLPGDGCGPTCKIEFCGDGIVQPTIQSLTYTYLGRTCGLGPTPIYFKVNGIVVAQDNLPESCDCLPGIRTIEVTDPALRAAGVNGTNSFELQTNGELAWTLGVVHTRTMGTGLSLWDYNDDNDVGMQNPDLCDAEAILGVGTGMGVNLSGGEICDDGNTVDDDSCNNNCEPNL